MKFAIACLIATAAAGDVKLGAKCTKFDDCVAKHSCGYVDMTT